MRLQNVIDGGYLSWVWGTKARRTTFWNQARFKYKDTSLIILDPSGPLAREMDDPQYKHARRAKRKRSEYKQYKSELVHQFREILMEDPVVPAVMVKEYEADDIVALIWLNAGPDALSVVGVDKDYLQVPGLWKSMFDIRGEKTRQDWIYTPKLFPQYVLDETDTYQDFVFAQVMLGDSSDSVPRILPRNGKVVYSHLKSAGTGPLAAAYEMFGEPVIRNLKLILMPHYSLRVDGVRHGEELINLVDSGLYWDASQFVDPRDLGPLGLLRTKFRWW